MFKFWNSDERELFNIYHKNNSTYFSFFLKSLKKDLQKFFWKIHLPNKIRAKYWLWKHRNEKNED